MKQPMATRRKCLPASYDAACDSGERRHHLTCHLNPGKQKRLSMISEQTIQQAALLLGEAAKPAQVILFGSYARGDAREDSDVDFLVIESEPHDKFSEMVRLRQVVRPLKIPVDVLVCSQAEVTMHQGSCSSAVYWALREGRVVYAEPN